MPPETIPLVNRQDTTIPIEPSPTEDFKTFHQQITENNIDKKYLVPAYLNSNHPEHPKHIKPALVLACEGRGNFVGVDTLTLQLLINRGSDIHYIDHEWYGWEPLHYAAYASNPNKLRTICDNIDPERINSLTMLSENALHVLLEHSSKARSFNIPCQNGQESTMAKIISKEQDDIVECANILIRKKININHPNFWNETPILIAIKRRYFQVAELLRHQVNIDLDGCKDAVAGSTARQLLKFRFLKELPTSTTPETLLFGLLKSGDEEGFIKFNGGNIRDFLGDGDGDSDLNSSCDMLQYCFRRGLIFWFDDTRGCDSERSEDLTTDRMVEVFCRSGMAKCVLHLLDQGINVNSTLPKFENKSVLEAAITRGYYPMVALILEKLPDNKLPLETICRALKEMVDNNRNYFDLNNTLLVVLTRLFEIIEVVSTVDRSKVLETLKSLLQQVKKISKTNQLLLLKFPGSLCWTTKATKSCWSYFKPKRHSVLEKVDPEVSRTHLDQCVTQSNSDVCINCTSFLEDNSLHSVFKLHMASSNLRESLNHIVFKILIMRQWESLRPQWRFFPLKYFYINLVFHAIFYSILNIFILTKFNDAHYLPLEIIVWMHLVIFILKEVVQFLANHKSYIKEATNYLEMSLIGCTLLVLCSNEDWVDIFEVLTVLISNIVLLSLLMTLPACAKYIIILRTIAFYFRYLFFYLIQFLAFAICFYILFAQKDQVWYAELSNRFFDTIILFTGNLEYMETPWRSETNSTTLFHQNSYSEPFAKFIFIVFVFFLAIILQNLLLGLLVIDIESLQKDVTVTEQVKRASFVVRLEKLFSSPCLKCVPKKLRYKKTEFRKELKVEDDDRKALTEDERQHLDFMLTKQLKEVNVLKKLKKHIKKRINEKRRQVKSANGKSCESVDKLEILEEMIKKVILNSKNSEIAEKLEMMEIMIKKLQK